MIHLPSPGQDDQEEPLDQLFDSELSPHDAATAAILAAEIRQFVSDNRESSEQGELIALPARPFIRPGVVAGTDLQLEPEIYLFESRQSGVPVSSAGRPEPLDHTYLNLVHLPKVLEVLWRQLQTVMDENKVSLAAGNMLSFRPALECGPEVCSELNNRLGEDYALSELRNLADGSPLYYVVRMVSDPQERANRKAYLPMKMPWSISKGL